MTTLSSNVSRLCRGRMPFAALITTTLAAGCGTETGNGAVTVKVGLTSTGTGGSDTVLVGSDAQGTSLSISSARASVRHIELHRPSGKTSCEGYETSNTARVKCDGGKVRVNGPFDVDLLTRTARPSLEGLAIPPDTYRRLDVRLEAAKVQDGLIAAGDPLEGESLLVSGTIAYPAGSSTPFELALRFDGDARFEDGAGFVVEADGVSEVLLLLDVAAWFASAPITQCIEDGELVITGGRLIIEDKGAGRCKDLTAALVDAVKSSGRLKTPK